MFKIKENLNSDDYRWSKARMVWIFIISVILVTAVIAGYTAWTKYQKNQMKQIIEEYAPDGVLTYGADDSSPPLRFADKDGTYKGVTIDLMSQLSLEMGVEIKCKPYKFSDGVKAVEKGDTDMMDLFENSERAKYLVFSDPIYTLRTIIVCGAGTDYDLNDIDHLTVATQEGDYANGYMKEHYGGADLVYVHDVGEGLSLLVDGKVDAVVGDEPVVQYYATTLNVKDKISTIDTSLYEQPVKIAVPKSEAALIKPLNVAIAKVRKSGQLEKIQQKWFGISTPLISTNNGSEILKYFFIILLFAICAVLFKRIENATLRRQVKIRTVQLEQSRNELKLMFNEMPEGVLMLNKDKIIMNINDPAAAIFHADIGSAKGKVCKVYLAGICGGCEECIIRECLTTGQEQRKKTAKGRSIYELRTFLINTEDDSTDNVMMTINDVTVDEIKNKQLLQSSKMMAVGELAAGMAHQLRNPLGVIRTQSYILRKNAGDADKAKIALNYIDDNVKRAGGIIDNVMNFWRISDVAIEPIELKKFIESIISLNGDAVKKNGTSVSLSCRDDLVLHSSQESLKHILLNVVQNAIEAVEPGYGVINISVDEIGNSVVIDCRDNGCGISEDNLANLYDPFFTTKPPGKGTGLGMFIAYTEIENLGGDIAVESAVGQGTTFRITIPDAVQQVQEDNNDQ